MRILTLAKRIITQTLHDIRTLLLVLLAPIAVLSMIYFILNAEDNHYSIGLIKVSEELEQALEDNEDYDITLTHVTCEEAETLMKEQKLDGAVLEQESGNITLYLSGTDVSIASKVQLIVKSTQASLQKETLNEHLDMMNEKLSHFELPKIEVEETQYETIYVTGTEDGSLFDKFGSQLIGIIVFFFVFLIAGINFLNERTSGTMEKLLSTPIRRYEIVCGYVLGYGVMALLQSSLITLFAVYVLGLTVKGNILLVLLVILLTAINALCLGILLSTVANSEFQMVQFIPIVILPQIFLAGLFRMTGIWNTVGYFVPLHYTAHALTNVMLIGNDLWAIRVDLLVLFALSLAFLWVNILLLKRLRKL